MAGTDDVAEAAYWASRPPRRPDSTEWEDGGEAVAGDHRPFAVRLRALLTSLPKAARERPLPDAPTDEGQGDRPDRPRSLVEWRGFDYGPADDFQHTQTLRVESVDGDLSLGVEYVRASNDLFAFDDDLEVTFRSKLGTFRVGDAVMVTIGFQKATGPSAPGAAATAPGADATSPLHPEASG